MALFKTEDKPKITDIVRRQAHLILHEDAAQIHLRAPSLTELTAFHSEHSVTPQQIRPANLEDVFFYS